MFPLGTVVFPHTVLPLRIFEPRYRRLTQDCLAGGREFGVVLIERGSEVGGGDLRSGVGTLVSIVEAQEAADGQWGLLTLGTRRIRVTAWLEDDPYPRAEVEELADPPWDARADEAFAAADRAVRRSLALLAELDEPAPPMHVELADERPAAAWQLAAIAPLGPLDRQRLLVTDDPAARLALLADLVEEECAVLAQRLAGG
jgi:Lon protease-like protein